MPRSMWSGSVSFGLVNVPVKLYSAVSSHHIQFHQLHASDKVRVRQKYVCPADNEEVAYESLVKGYEISRDRYVVIAPEELEALDPKAARTIEIEDFVDLDQIDPIFFVHPYYLVPDKGAAKAYALLLTAMRNTGKVAVARVVMRNKEYLVALRPLDRVLSMTTMRFADEIVPVAELEGLPPTDEKPDNRQLELAERIVNSQSVDFRPENYRDEYRERVLELIERKAQGKEVVEQLPEEEGAKVIDLMSALEASIAAAEKKPSDRAPKKKGA